MNLSTSVVMAVYNGESYLISQLDSIRCQTRPADEVIISDDGSTDGSYDLIKRYIKEHSLNNWILTKNKHNIGYNANFSQLFNIATGDLIFPSDQDDIWTEKKIELMAKIMEEKLEINVLGSDRVIIKSENIKHSNLNHLNKNIKENRSNFVEKVDFVPYVIAPGCCVCFRKELMKHYNKMKGIIFSYDRLIWCIGYLTNSSYSYKNKLVLHRRHESSATYSDKKIRKPIEKMQLLEKKINEMILFRNYVIKKNTNISNLLPRIERSICFYGYRVKFINTFSIKLAITLLKFLDLYSNILIYFADFFDSFYRAFKKIHIN